MGFFWFLVSVVLLIVVLRRANGNQADGTDYTAGYRDGYRAFGDEVQVLLDQNTADRTRLRALIRKGRDDAVQEATPALAFTEEPLMIVDEPTAALTVRPVELTDEQRAARSLQNLNTILYMASFLLVAAGALFVGAAMPDMVKLIGVWVVIAAFYGAGYILHKTVARLRPAASAFLGTGLALVPFGGVALGQYTHLSAEVAWLITSLIGFGAYILAALRLQNQLVSYLTLAFVLSFAGSVATVADAGLVGQFILFILVSLLANVIAVLRPKWVPVIFKSPIERTGQVVTPIVLVASLVLGRFMTAADYEIISLVALLHYIVAWLQTRTLVLETAIRLLASFVVVIFVADYSKGDVASVGLSLALIAAGQQAYSLALMNRPGRRSVERQWIEAVFVIQALVMLCWQGSAHAALYNVIGLTLLGLTSLVTALRFRYVKVGLIGLIVSLVLPIVITRDLFVPALPWWATAAVFGVLAAAALWGYNRLRFRSSEVRTFMAVGYVAYVAAVLIAARCDGQVLVQLMAYSAVAVMVHAASHIMRQAWVQFASAVLLFVAVCYAGLYAGVPCEWLPLFIGSVTAALLWMITGAYASLGSARRTTYGLVTGQLAFAVVGFGIMAHMPLVSRWTVAALLLAAIATLFVRYRYGPIRRAIAVTASLSYSSYFVLAVLGGLAVSNQWAVGVLTLGIAFFVVASYIERSVILQLVASACLVVALALLALVLRIPFEWSTLFILGGASLAHYAATALHAAFGQAERQFLVVTTGQVLLFLLSLGSLFNQGPAARLTTAIILIMAAASFALRWWNRDRSLRYESLFQVSYVALYLVGLILSLQLENVWGVIGLALGGVIFWGASYAERSPLVLAVGNVLFSFAIMRFWGWMGFDLTWFVVGVGWVLAVVFYLGYGIFTGLRDTVRQQIMLWSAGITLALSSLVEMTMSGFTLDVALMIFAFALVIGIEAYRRRSWLLGEGAMYIGNIAFQRLLGALYPELNAVFYAHEWAALVLLVALLRRQGVRPRAIVAMALVTLSTGGYALAQGGFYQLLFLAEHLALLVVGAFRQKGWAIWWGIGTSAAAILYFLREYTFLWLGFLGLLLIAIVVWRLMRMSSSDAQMTK
jgi:hypothetical protein